VLLKPSHKACAAQRRSFFVKDEYFSYTNYGEEYQWLTVTKKNVPVLKLLVRGINFHRNLEGKVFCMRDQESK